MNVVGLQKKFCELEGRFWIFRSLGFFRKTFERKRNFIKFFEVSSYGKRGFRVSLDIPSGIYGTVNLIVFSIASPKAVFSTLELF